MSTFAQPIPYIVVGAAITFISVVYTASRTAWLKKMEFEEANRIRTEDLALEEKKAGETERKKKAARLAVYEQHLASIGDHFTRDNMQSISLTSNELQALDERNDVVMNMLRKMKAFSYLGDVKAQACLAELEKLSKDFRGELTTKVLYQTNGQQPQANAQIQAAGRIIGNAHVEINDLKAQLRKM